MFKLSLLMLIVSLMVASDGQKVYRLIREKIPWNDAFRMCQDDGGRLATIESEDETQAVKVFLETETNKWPESPCFDSDKNDFYFWIAGQRLNPGQPGLCRRPFHWKLPNDLQKELEYKNWAQGNPICIVEYGGCIEVTFISGFKWKEKPCSKPTCPLCQIV